ncbi:YbaK/EbsC family protein [Polycladidibacter hongkongensis]|uniref:YbaK/EbsC family protein n=1 Tax=Polycladidibacter hongkongensis TaxID=1647556 RepID=UPI00082C7E68|nr:YbaK/EbsC family protein [Pseudovibrio hongkongensis]
MAKQSSKERVKAAAEAAGLAIEIVQMQESTRTAEEAAAACGCQIGQIVKSLIFAKGEGEAFVLLLIAGDRQADLVAAQQQIGSQLQRADPKAVRAKTGFAIGGVAPLGHNCPVEVFMDPALLQYPVVWAAAGAPNAVFSVAPQALQDAVGAQLLHASPVAATGD